MLWYSLQILTNETPIKGLDKPLAPHLGAAPRFRGAHVEPKQVVPELLDNRGAGGAPRLAAWALSPVPPSLACRSTRDPRQSVTLLLLYYNLKVAPKCLWNNLTVFK